MKNIINKIKKTGRKNLALGGLVASSLWICGNTGCQTLNPQGQAFMQNLGGAMVTTYALESIKAEVNPNQVNIYVPEQQVQSQNIVQSQSENQGQVQQNNNLQIPPRLLIYNKFVDLNNDKKAAPEEFFGLGKKVYDLNEEEMNVNLSSMSYSGSVIFRSWTTKGNLIGETKIDYVNKFRILGRSSGPNGPTSGDFMDNLKGAGPGDYVITATLDNGENFREEIKTK